MNTHSSPPIAVIHVRNGTVFTTKEDDVRTVMEKALRFVEKFTKKPRSEWEHKIQHPFVKAANKIAKRLAGIPESRSVKGAPLKPSPFHHR